MAPPKIVDAPEVRLRHGRLRRRHPVRRIVGFVALGLTVVLVATVGVLGISFLQLQGDVETVDLADGVDGLPPTDGLRLVAEDGSRVIVRPSGTEPKLKVYLDAQAGGATAAIARAEADAVIATLDAALRPLLTLS